MRRLLSPAIIVVLCSLLPATGSALEPLCGDSRRLEKRSRVGKLDAPTLSCLTKVSDKGGEGARNATTLILNNAWARGDRIGWRQVAEHYLRDVDPHDPEVAYQYAQHLQRHLREPQVALDWLDVAYENRYIWSRQERPTKLVNLHEVRTRAALELAYAAEKRLRQDDSQQNRLDAYRLRARTRLYSIAWAQQANALSRDISEPMRLCAESGWTIEDCASSATEPPPP